jgi:alkylation response protein AidB-like acyl-CoA dehydrogenase
MAFNDLLAGQFGTLAGNALSNIDVAAPDAVVTALADNGCLDLEIPLELDGPDMGLVAAIEVFMAIGKAGGAVLSAELNAAATDLLVHQAPEQRLALDQVRGGKVRWAATNATSVDGWALARVDESKWTLRAESFVLDACIGSPWWTRRRVRHAAYLTGLADCAYQVAVAHCRGRIVGGRPLLRNQLVAGRLVRLLGEVRLAWAATREAALAIDHDPTAVDTVNDGHDLARHATIAASRDLIQLLGARGMTSMSLGPRLYRLAHEEAYRLPASLGEVRHG